MKKDYANKLLNPRWQKRRLEILQRDDFTCQECYDSESTLHVHHVYYVKGRQPWEYPDCALITLCSDCHKRHDLTEWEEFLGMMLDTLPPSCDAFGQSGLWDIANQCKFAREAGATRNECLGVLLYAITEFKNERNEEVVTA